MSIPTPTFRLLTVSLPVAISGAFRLYIAFLFLGVEGNVSLYLAFALLVYATYTLDRALGCEEDRVNRSELEGAKQEVPILLCIISLLSAAFILSCHALEEIVLLPAAIGYLYSRGIKFGGFVIKLKGSYGAKNLVVGITWGALIAGIMRKWSSNLASLLSINIFIFQHESFYQLGDIRLQRYQRRRCSRNKNASRDARGKENENCALNLAPDFTSRAFVCCFA